MATPPSPWQSPKYTGEPWWMKDTVVVVTGSNRGIGYNILRTLAQHGLTTVLTDRVDTQASVAALKAEGLGDFVFHHHLDVTSSSSVNVLANWLKEQFGGFDILINNAGVGVPLNTGYESAMAVVEVNYFGVKKATEGLLPVLRKGGRIINVTSRLGFYQRLGEEMKNKFQDVEHLSFESLDALASKYGEDEKSGQFEQEGWLSASTVDPQYSVSKMLLSAYTLVLAKSLQSQDQKAYVCAFCPGLTATSMIEGRDVVPGIIPHAVEIGIDTGVWLALLPTDEIAQKHGKFFAERLEYPYTWNPWIDPFRPPA